MNIWKRLRLVEVGLRNVGSWREHRRLMDQRYLKHKNMIAELANDINGIYSGDENIFQLWSSRGLKYRLTHLEKKVRDQGEIIEQLAALHGKEITSPAEQEYEKILVDISEDEH